MWAPPSASDRGAARLPRSAGAESVATGNDTGIATTVKRSPQTLSDMERRLVAHWAADCAARVLHLFETQRPADPRPRAAIARTRAFAEGTLATAIAIRDRFEGGAAATEAASPAAIAAARSAGQAAAVCHMAAHALGAAAYAAEAAGATAPGSPEAADGEIRWQLAHMSPAVRATLQLLPPLGQDRAGPLGMGLLTHGSVGTAIRHIQQAIADPDAMHPSQLAVDHG